jgi:hypothetical protein
VAPGEQDTRVGDYEVIREVTGSRRAGVVATSGEQNVLIVRYDVPADRYDTLVEELTRTQAIEHAAVPRMVEHFEADGQTAIALAHVEGLCLSNIIDHLAREGEQLADGAALYIGGQIAAALAEARRPFANGKQQIKLAHPRLDPDHILITWQGDVLLAGLGMSVLYEQGDALEDPPPSAYQPSDAVPGAPASTDDNVYSVAAIVWTLLTNTPAANATTANSLRNLRPQLNPQLAFTLQRVLTSATGNRKLTIQALANLLGRNTSEADTAEIRWNAELLRANAGTSSDAMLDALPANRDDELDSDVPDDEAATYQYEISAELAAAIVRADNVDPLGDALPQPPRQRITPMQVSLVTPDLAQLATTDQATTTEASDESPEPPLSDPATMVMDPEALAEPPLESDDALFESDDDLFDSEPPTMIAESSVPLLPPLRRTPPAEPAPESVPEPVPSERIPPEPIEAAPKPADIRPLVAAPAPILIGQMPGRAPSPQPELEQALPEPPKRKLPWLSLIAMAVAVVSILAVGSWLVVGDSVNVSLGPKPSADPAPVASASAPPVASEPGPVASSAAAPEQSAVELQASAQPKASAAEPEASAAEPEASAAEPVASAAEPVASAAEPEASATSATSVTVEEIAKAALELPQSFGFLIVRSRAEAGVYTGSVRLGMTNERIRLRCGSRYVRLGTVPLKRWLERGKPISVNCRGVAIITLQPQ